MIYVVLLNIDVKNWKCEDVRMNVKQSGNLLMLVISTFKFCVRNLTYPRLLIFLLCVFAVVSGIFYG